MQTVRQQNLNADSSPAKRRQFAGKIWTQTVRLQFREFWPQRKVHEILENVKQKEMQSVRVVVA
eukprot:215391-Amphidinium_carterae.1